MSDKKPLEDMLVSEVLTRWPQTITVFQWYNLFCFGCYVASFCTIRYVADVYSIPLPELLAKLATAVSSNSSRNPD